MPIRKSTNNDYARLADLWLKTSLSAHHFIDDAYWTANRKEMEERYLPMAETFVIEEEGRIDGFVSMAGKYLAALFIDEERQGGGLGRKLLDHVKQGRDEIELKVYVRNVNAFRFYLKQGFTVMEELTDEATGEREYRMVWNNTN
jgi:Acetyltransferases